MQGALFMNTSAAPVGAAQTSAAQTSAAVAAPAAQAPVPPASGEQQAVAVSVDGKDGAPRPEPGAGAQDRAQHASEAKYAEERPQNIAPVGQLRASPLKVPAHSPAIAPASADKDGGSAPNKDHAPSANDEDNSAKMRISEADIASIAVPKVNRITSPAAHASTAPPGGPQSEEQALSENHTSASNFHSSRSFDNHDALPTYPTNLPKSAPHRPPNARVFIGNLASEHTNTAELTSIFYPYGELIEEPVLRRSFGFVQYSTAEAAQRAIAAENGRNIGGMRVDLSLADNREARRDRTSPNNNSSGRSSRNNSRRGGVSGSKRRRSLSPTSRKNHVRPPQYRPARPESIHGIHCRILVMGPAALNFAHQCERTIRSVTGLVTDLLSIATTGLGEALTSAARERIPFVVVIATRNVEGRTCSVRTLEPSGYEKCGYGNGIIKFQEAVDIIMMESGLSQPSAQVPLPAPAQPPGQMAPMQTAPLGWQPRGLYQPNMAHVAYDARLAEGDPNRPRDRPLKMRRTDRPGAFNEGYDTGYGDQHSNSPHGPGRAPYDPAGERYEPGKGRMYDPRGDYRGNRQGRDARPPASQRFDGPPNNRYGNRQMYGGGAQMGAQAVGMHQGNQGMGQAQMFQVPGQQGMQGPGGLRMMQGAGHQAGMPGHQPGMPGHQPGMPGHLGMPPPMPGMQGGAQPAMMAQQAMAQQAMPQQAMPLRGAGLQPGAMPLQQAGPPGTAYPPQGAHPGASAPASSGALGVDLGKLNSLISTFSQMQQQQGQPNAYGANSPVAQDSRRNGAMNAPNLSGLLSNPALLSSLQAMNAGKPVGPNTAFPAQNFSQQMAQPGVGTQQMMLHQQQQQQQQQALQHLQASPPQHQGYGR